MADKITSVSKMSDTNSEMEATKTRYISPENRQPIIAELRLV